jgi:hypothetical protein
MQHKLNLFKNEKQTLHYIIFRMTDNLLQNSPVSIFHPPIQNTLMQNGFEKSQPLGNKNSGSGFVKQKVTTSNFGCISF